MIILLHQELQFLLHHLQDLTAVGVATMIGDLVDCSGDKSDSKVQGVEIVNAGYGYTVAPSVAFFGAVEQVQQQPLQLEMVSLVLSLSQVVVLDTALHQAFPLLMKYLNLESQLHLQRHMHISMVQVS